MSGIVMFPLKGRRLSKAEEFACSAVYENGSCAAEIIKKGGGIHAIRIVLHGDAAHFPSTSNDREIKRRRTKEGFDAAFIGHTAKTVGRMEGAKMLFRDAIGTYPGDYPSFKSEPVCVAAFLAAKPGVWDSHNFCKPIGDWLEALELIDDDCQAEIFCFKKTDYPQTFFDKECTEIVVQRRENVEVLNEAFLSAVRCAALPSPGRIPDPKPTRNGPPAGDGFTRDP